MRKAIFGGKTKPAEPEIPESENMRAELGRLQQVAAQLGQWLGSLEGAREQALAAALEDPVFATKRLAEFDVWLAQGSAVRAYLNGRISELRDRYKNRVSWESQDRGRRIRLADEKKRPRSKGNV